MKRRTRILLSLAAAKITPSGCGSSISADRCSWNLIPGQSKCGLLAACKPAYCYIKGQCDSDTCPLGTH